MPGHGQQEAPPPGQPAVRHEARPPAEASHYEPPLVGGHPVAPDLPGYEPPDLLSNLHRSAAAPGRLAALAVQAPAVSIPGLPSTTTAAILAVAGLHGPERASDLPGVSSAGAPSFYFIDERPSATDWPRACDFPVAVPVDAYPAFHVEAVRRDFPVLQERIHGRQLVWLDNGATTQKPQVVIDRLAYFYSHENSNIHRSAHSLAARSSDAYESARATVADFLGAPSAGNIVFTRGTTEAINLVAQSFGDSNIHQDDEILVSHLEHHANIVPWQQLAAETGAKLKVIPVDDDGQLLLDAYGDLLSERTKVVAVAQVSNVLGTIVPVKKMIEMAHRVGATVVVDGAQAVAHMVVDVQEMDADFYVFSGHKIFAPPASAPCTGRPSSSSRCRPGRGAGT